MTKEDYERYKELEQIEHRGHTKFLTQEDIDWLEDAYDRLTPQQKGAIHRKWKERADEEYYADAMNGMW